MVQFSLAGRTDPGNKVGSWGPWTKAPITSIVISIVRWIFAFNSPIIYALYVFPGMFVCDLCFLVSSILTSFFTQSFHHTEKCRYHDHDNERFSSNVKMRWTGVEMLAN